MSYNDLMEGFLKDVVSEGYKTNLLACSMVELDDYAFGVDNGEVDIRIIKGEECLNKEELWLEWSTVLEFPDTFKGGWDGFDECLQDLSWLAKRRLLVVVENFDLLLSKDLDELMTFLDIVNDGLISQPIHWKIVFHCQKDKEVYCQEILEHASMLHDVL